jgi:ferredoxin-NADP reductase
MKQELLEKLDGYSDIMAKIETSRQEGSDFQELKGTVARYLEQLHPNQVNLELIEITEETESSRTLRFAAKEGNLPPFQAGQYIALHIDTGRIKTSRPYSISSPPSRKDYWDLTVQRVENGLVSNYLLDEVKTGDHFASSGPQGTFCFNPLIHDDNIVCLAGGSGVTPFLSMIREQVDKGSNRRIALLYGVREPKDAIFYDELISLAEKHDSIHFHPVFENPPDGFQGPTGYITADVIKKTIGDLEDKTFFICGPQAMYDFCLEQLKELKIPGRKIRREMYGAPANPWDCEGWPSEIPSDQSVSVTVTGARTVSCLSGESLLNVLEKNGLKIPAICRSGECSMCRVRLLKGKVFQPKGTLLRKSDRMFGFIHSCVSYPLTDVEIRL